MAADTAAIYMGAGEGAVIAAALLEAGKPPATPVAVVESASLPQASVRFGTLATLAQIAPREARGENAGPALILLGEVLEAAQALAGDEAVLRAASQSE
jgi:siroheme synthase